MSCECFKIGGRFIAEDPDCPAHGTEAQARDKENARRSSSNQHTLQSLRDQVLEAETFEELRSALIEIVDYLNEQA